MRPKRLIKLIALFLPAIVQLPLRAVAQQEVSAETVWKQCKELFLQGRLDSMNVAVSLGRNSFHRVDSLRRFYVYADTIRLEKGCYAVGHCILDPFLEFNLCPVGPWTCHYANGTVQARGDYAVGSYTECSAGGPSQRGYSYRSGPWNFWSADGLLMSRGSYRTAEQSIQTNCGVDHLLTAYLVSGWKFYPPDSHSLFMPAQFELP